jgi:hypothetical protein
VLERILAEKAKQAPQRAGETTTKPPLFTDVPTKVAPLPVQEALLGDKFNEQGTPLPKPMPFHSDAEDFDEQAFEEATKVRALDELIAQTADGGDAGTATAIIPPDELAARRMAAGARADSTLADPPMAPPGSGPIGVAKASQPDRDSAPGLPSPPAAGQQPRLLDTTPSPRSVNVEVPPPELGKTRLGVNAPAPRSTQPPATKSTPAAPTPVAPTPTRGRDSSPVVKDAPTRPSGMQAVATEPSGPSKRPMAPKQKSSAMPVVILLLFVIAGGAAGVWFFYLRPKWAEENGTQPNPTTPPSPSPSVVKTGSDGSNVAVKPSESPNPSPSVVKAGSNGSGEVEPPKGPTVDTVIGSSVDKGTTVEIVGTDMKGPAPFTAKLEKDKPYKVRISAPGFATLEMEVKGGDKNVMGKLVAKPHIISVTSEPAGALIFVDNAATGHTTPHEVELTKQQAAKKSVQILIKKGGYKPIVKTVALDAYEEADSQMLAKLDEKLSVQVQINRPSPTPTPSASPSPSPSPGSAAVSPNPTPSPSPSPSASPSPTPAGGGSAVKPSPSPSPSVPAGSAAKPPSPSPSVPAGSAAKPPSPAPATTGSAAATKPPEPEPDFVKK